MVFCDVRRVELGQDRDLLDDIFDLIFGVLDVDDLDRDGLACALIDTAQAAISLESAS